MADPRYGGPFFAMAALRCGGPLPLTLMVTVSSNPNPTANYHCEFVNLNCIFAQNAFGHGN